MKKVCVILGAGASADAWNASGPPATPEWKPPLAKELFGQRDTFWGFMQRFPGVRVLSAELAEVVRSGTIALEAKLLEYARHPDKRISERFKEVPPYLRELILAVVEKHTGGISPGTHLRLVMRLLSSGHKLGFLDLNYDDYLEMALVDFDPGLAISSLPHYVAAERQAIVGKVHGSVHWGTPFALQDFRDSLRDFDPLSPPTNVVLERSKRDSFNWRHPETGHLLYPVITAPLAGKDHSALVCPPGHLKAFQAFLEGCRHYLVIGTSGQDDDLLSFLNQSVSAVDLVHYVNYMQNATLECQQRIEAASPVFSRAMNRLPFPHGFRAYLGSQEFQDFVQS